MALDGPALGSTEDTLQGGCVGGGGGEGEGRGEYKWESSAMLYIYFLLTLTYASYSSVPSLWEGLLR